MPRSSRAWASTALWAFAAGILFLLSISPFLYTSPSRENSNHYWQYLQRRDASTIQAVERGPAHQNPAKAPPEHLLPDAFVETVDNIELQSAERSAHAAYLASREVHESFALGKRDALRCDDGPCVDGSCCGKDHICGFGPDFCGAGCRSQCNATAMCGEHSENGEMPCGMKLCCSAMGWCGTTAAYCHNADPLRGSLPCQAGYGSCYITPSPPGCPYGGGSTNGRHVGYYQSWNVRNRLCNKVSPRQLDTAGYTHLFYSFASINPSTFRITPAHPDDDAMMREFTSLKRDGLQTWIAVGGFDFSDKYTPTHTTWSDVCATKASRTAFINSVREYMDNYGFQGVDLDWEYPGDPDRGGRKLQDVRKLVDLVREMRIAFGSAYGISLTLAPDYWYLRWFDAKALEPYVDFFGFMAYDLHGSWDADVLALGQKVRGQADIREIADNIIPLWFDGLNPAKINFGLAMYGRGYTLADPNCNQLLCPFEKASKPGPCTNFDGVMSLLEIQQLIKRRGLTPQYLPDSMMKQITWDDQWIGYDDDETFAAKKAWADSKCFGGTMVWSIDFQVSGSGDSPDEKYGEVVYVGSQVFETPAAQCPAPCIMVFPPSTLSEPKAVTMQPYTATLEVGTTTTTIVAVATPRTVTVSVIEFFNHYVTSAQQPGAVMTLRPSFQPPPVQLVVTGQDGLTTTRTVLPPPLGGGVSKSSSSRSYSSGSYTFPTTGIRPPKSGTNTPTPPTTGPPTATPETEPEIIDLPWPEEESDSDSDDDTPPIFPPVSLVVEPVTDKNKPPPPGGHRLKCDSWFFFICISWLDIKVEWWDIILPPGPIGPGPMPLDWLKLPTGWSVRCTDVGCLPPLPKMTIGHGGGFPPEPPAPTPCKPVTATLTIETTSYGTTTTEGTVRTITTRTLSSEFPILGCALTDVTASASKTACAAEPTPLAVRNVDSPAEQDFSGNVSSLSARPIAHAFKRRTSNRLVSRAPGCEVVDAFCTLTEFNPPNLGVAESIAEELQELVDQGRLGDLAVIGNELFVSFIFLTDLSVDALRTVRELNGIRSCHVVPLDRPDNNPSQSSKRQNDPSTEMDGLSNNKTTHRTLGRRMSSMTRSWALAHISVPPGVDVTREEGGWFDRADRTYKYRRHASECNDQWVFVIDERVDDTHPAFPPHVIEFLPEPAAYGKWFHRLRDDLVHATNGASLIAGLRDGRRLGVCGSGVKIVSTRIRGQKIIFNNDPSTEKKTVGANFMMIEALTQALDFIDEEGIGTRSVINMSFSFGRGFFEAHPDLDACLALLQRLDQMRVVLVAASGNAPLSEQSIDRNPPVTQYPQLWSVTGDLPSLIVVGATDGESRAALFSREIEGMVWAPGKSLPVASGSDYVNERGTSLASPIVAAMAAYYRGQFPPTAIMLPSVLKQLLQHLSRTVNVHGDTWQPGWEFEGQRHGPQKPVVWNGQLDDDLSCITDFGHPRCQEFFGGDSYDDEDGGGEDGGSDGGAIGGQDQLGPSKTFTYSSGPPSPTCSSGCGTLCTDYWCRPDRTGQPLHFTEPTRLPSITAAPSPGTGGGGKLPPNCISSTTAQVCFGLGDHRSCGLHTICVATSTPTPTPTPGGCSTSTVTTECFAPVGGSTACVSATSCINPPSAPTVAPLPGFPPPVKNPDLLESCEGAATCRSSRGFRIACDAAAQAFLRQEPEFYGDVPGLQSSVCVEGDYSSGTFSGRVGCRIRFEQLHVGGSCRWDRDTVQRAYSRMRVGCQDEGHTCGAVQMLSPESMCGITIDWVSECP